MPCFKLTVMVFICIEYFMQICSYVNVREFVLDLTFQVECTIIGLDLFFTLLSHKCIQVYYTRQHLCRWFNIFLVFPFVHLYVSLFFCLSHSWNLRQSFASQFLKWCISRQLLTRKHSYWTIITKEGWHSLHGPGPQG